MRILWLCNLPLPIIAEQLNITISNLGGWLAGACKPLLEDKNNSLIYLFPYTSFVEGNIDNLIYCSYEEVSIYNADESMTKRFVDIINKFQPEVIHIWGTEFAHSLSMAKAVEQLNLVDKMIISIQGIVYIYEKAYAIGLSEKVKRAKTIRDFIKKDNINIQQAKFSIRGKNEIATLKIAKHIIGRTQWDRESCFAVNDNLQYHYCNENLRKEFYMCNKWSYEKCNQHTIFCSQCNYPIKGFHFAIEALNILRKKYPDIKLRVAGQDFVNKTFLKRQRKTYYFTYLRNLVKKYHLENNIEFLGSLSAEKMINEYQHANVFLSPSTIENSSNSIAEAMLIGTPVVASNVGGCPSIIEDNISALMYNVADINTLADNISNIFDDTKLAHMLSNNAINVATERHNYTKNNLRLAEIYNELLK